MLLFYLKRTSYLLRAILPAPAIGTEAMIICHRATALLAPPPVSARPEGDVHLLDSSFYEDVVLWLRWFEARVSEGAFVAAEAGCTHATEICQESLVEEQTIFSNYYYSRH